MIVAVIVVVSPAYMSEHEQLSLCPTHIQLALASNLSKLSLKTILSQCNMTTNRKRMQWNCIINVLYIGRHVSLHTEDTVSCFNLELISPVIWWRPLTSLVLQPSQCWCEHESTSDHANKSNWCCFILEVLNWSGAVAFVKSRRASAFQLFICSIHFPRVAFWRTELRQNCWSAPVVYNHMEWFQLPSWAASLRYLHPDIMNLSKGHEVASLRESNPGLCRTNRAVNMLSLV